MTNEEQIQQKYMQFQMIQQQLEEVNQHLGMLNEQSSELDISIEAVKEIAKTKLDNEFLAPVANGIFIKGELKENQKLVVNVGMNTTVEKTIPEVVELLEEQKKDIMGRIIETDSMMMKMNSEAMKLFKEVEEEVQ
ncbi:prefoldin subunit alpha [Candidatus Woesearchaeota archaeon]|jgi:prefoldin alpha subunit|nr:prefoldin subunit alpha [Candidatus Woesearchaeota archaeon]MBT4111297.1 prefoldin subunit alpha [Candidatus Woesearchaeota archaeon]MBT4335792.1 prefoldin subunit alpha [Candidatus Woesearchaeota archaeon]MBT4469230.1 prefoldin subunit alpha [Candidatus Woesearchaeota archaeon]MBT6744395.1 prefoldin subunit alpha [Candidatus Woesearchaeota archaeon]